MNKKLVIALTGGIGSGKSLAANFFTKLGVDVIDADHIVHELLDSNTVVYKKILEYFSGEILDSQGKINRTRLKNIIFADADKKRWLEQLLHPQVRKIMQQQTEHSQSPYCILIIPLVFETTPNPMIDRTLVIDSAEELQIQRAMQRDNISKEMVLAIMDTQVPRKVRLQKADDIIVNDADINNLKGQVIKMHEFYLQL